MNTAQIGEVVRLNDELIKQALLLYDQRTADEIHERYLAHAEELPDFSEKFKMRMRRLSKKQKLPRLVRRRWFRAAVIAAAVIALIAFLAFGVTGIRERLFGLFLEERTHASFVLYSDESELRETIETKYMPKCIPEEFGAPVCSVDNHDLFELIYDIASDEDRGDGAFHRILFNQYTKSWAVSIDTEQADVQYIAFREGEAIYTYKERANGEYSLQLMWFEDGYVFSIFLQNVGDKETLLSIAESVSPAP